MSGWPHSLVNLMQNGVGSTQGSVHMHWDVPNADFTADLCYAVKSNPGKGDIGWFIWREQDSAHYYQMQMHPTRLAIALRNGPLPMHDLISTPIVIDETHDLMVRVTVKGDHHQIWILNEDDTVGKLLLDLHDTVFMSGVNHSYYTNPGVNGCWDFVRARPI